MDRLTAMAVLLDIVRSDLDAADQNDPDECLWGMNGPYGVQSVQEAVSAIQEAVKDAEVADQDLTHQRVMQLAEAALEDHGAVPLGYVTVDELANAYIEKHGKGPSFGFVQQGLTWLKEARDNGMVPLDLTEHKKALLAKAMKLAKVDGLG